MIQHSPCSFLPFFIPSSQGGYGVLRCYSIAVLQSTSRIRASFIGCIPYYGRFSRCCRISMVLHILWACAFCPAFMIRLATALVRYSAGGNGFISPSLSDLFSFSFPAFPLLLLAEVGIIFRCKDSVQPGAACGLCQWRVCENLPLSGRRFAIKAK